tara:strand:- start:3022 stop:3237 length:216 start_codon:yes stop_codon:yes gene_type:complete
MEHAEALAKEIWNMNHKMYELQETIYKKTQELERICPHEKLREEYDDDFHKPRHYYLCLTCGTELNINNKR